MDRSARRGKEHYQTNGGDFRSDEVIYRRGFEAALHPRMRGRSLQECAQNEPDSSRGSYGESLSPRIPAWAGLPQESKRQSEGNTANLAVLIAILGFSALITSGLRAQCISAVRPAGLLMPGGERSVGLVIEICESIPGQTHKSIACHLTPGLNLRSKADTRGEG